MEQLYRQLQQQPGLELRRNEPMSRHTTFRVGGPAALMALPADVEGLIAALASARQLDVPAVVVGAGSNLLVDDGGVDALVIKTVPRMAACEVEGTVLRADAGLPLPALAACAARAGLTGLEFAHGIPGSVGGAVYMNAGAYQQEMSQVVSSVRALDGEAKVRQLTGEECAFAYRSSVFAKNGWQVLSADYRLTPGDPAAIQSRMEELMARRKEKQPLEYPSAGSFFKRPQGHFAAALIDGCGLKGLQVGGAQVSEKHAGFLVNVGGATCHDILTLADRVREHVLRQTGVELEPEVKYLR